MNSQLFSNNVNLEIAEKAKALINHSENFLSASTAQSPRAAGDAIQDIVADGFEQILGAHCAKYSSDFARRAMADLAFEDTAGNYYIVDVKTHRLETKFNMPNLTSVERLARFYEDDKNYFTLLLASYSVEGVAATVADVKFIPIEFLDWGCLTVDALGWGQIQISNSNKVKVNQNYSRKDWMLEFCDVMLQFYPKEILKIQERSVRFEEVKAYWQNK